MEMIDEITSKAINTRNEELDRFIAESLLRFYGINTSDFDVGTLAGLEKLKAVIDSFGISLKTHHDGIVEICSDGMPPIVGGPFGLRQV
jgi:hypothetical protein